MNKVEDRQVGGAGGHLRLTISSPPAGSPAFSAALPPRGSQVSAEGEVKRDVGGQSSKAGTAEAGSPLLGNTHNPNVADVPGRRAMLAAPTVSSDAGKKRKGGVQRQWLVICCFDLERLIQHDAEEHLCLHRTQRRRPRRRAASQREGRQVPTAPPPH